MHAWFHAACRLHENVTKISSTLLCRKRCEIFAKSIRNISIPFLYLISCSMQIARKFYSDFTQISRRLSCRIRCGPFAESMRNLSMPNTCSIPCSLQISRKRHADLTQTTMQSVMRNLCGIHTESICLMHVWFHATCCLDTNFTQSLRRLPCKMRCGIFPESMRNISMPYACLIPCRMQFSRTFHADLTQTSMWNAIRNLCGINAESIYALCMLDSLVSSRLPSRMRCGIFAESMQNLCGIHAASIYA